MSTPGLFRKSGLFTLTLPKYQHAYSYEDMERDIRNAFFSIYEIEKTLQRRKPTLARWEGYYMANTDKWYYAYKIEDDTIVVTDACHSQNMKI